MCHSLCPDRAARPCPLDSVDAGLDSDLASEILTVPTIRAFRSSAAEARHARYSKPLVIAEWLQPYVLPAAALRRPAQPLAAEQITLQAVRCPGASAVDHPVLPFGFGV